MPLSCVHQLLCTVCLVKHCLYCSDMLGHYRILLRRKVEKEETAWKESHFISGVFDTIAAGLQVVVQ